MQQWPYLLFLQRGSRQQTSLRVLLAALSTTGGRASGRPAEEMVVAVGAAPSTGTSAGRGTRVRWPAGGVRCGACRCGQSWREGPTLILLGFFGTRGFSKQRTIKLRPGIIIHCTVVNRCHEAHQLAMDMIPDSPSFTGFSVHFLLYFAS